MKQIKFRNGQYAGYYDIAKGKRRISGAGVLLVTYFDNVIPSVVLIHSKSKKAYEEPGGGSHNRHTVTKDYGDVMDTARRELFEETACLIDVSDPKMYRYALDTNVRRRDDIKWYYRSYVMHVNGITRKHFLHNYRKLLKQGAPKEFLESDNLVIVPLHFFKNENVIQIERERFAIQINDKLLFITKRLKRIMENGGLEMAYKVLNESPPCNALLHFKTNKNEWKKDTITLHV